MAISGLSVLSAFAASQQSQPLSLSPGKHTRHQLQSITDVDAQSSSVANVPSTSSPAGHKVNILA